MANQFLSQISLGTQAVLIYTGNGSPEGVETAPVGSVYLNATASNAANAFYVKGSGTGNAGWSLLAASTIPAGSDTEIQFNDAGVSAGDPQLTWNKTTNTITIGSTNNAGIILVKDKGEVMFEEDNDNGSNYVSLNAPASLSSSVNLTLPSSLPGASSGFLIASSLGVLNFAATNRLLYNDSTGGIELVNAGNNANFFVVKDSLSNNVFSIGYETFVSNTIPRFYTDFIMNNSVSIFAEDTDGDPTEIFTLYGDSFYFGPYDKDGVLSIGMDVYIRYGRGNAGFDSAITISGINYYIDIPLAITANPPAKTGATNPKLLSISGANANHTTTVAGDVNDISFNLSRNVQFTTGSTISAIRAFYINPPTYVATAATQTITHASTVSISGAPVKSTNVAITNTSALRIEAGEVSTATTAYGIYVQSPTGAAANYALYIGGKTQIVPDVHTSGSPVGILYTGAAHTTLTASVESSDLYLNLTRTVQFAAGALTTQRAIRIDAPIYSFVSSSTITDASTVAISGPPVAGTNATITNSYALSIESGNMALRNEGGLHLFEAIGNGSNKLIFKAASSLSANSTYAWPIAPVSYPDGYGHYVLTGNGGNLAWTVFNSVTLAPHHYNTVPSGAVDGSNDVFVLAHIPALGTERVYKNGLRQKPGSGNDYTITSDTITFESGNIPKIGDVILADYIEGESIL